MIFYKKFIYSVLPAAVLIIAALVLGACEASSPSNDSSPPDIQQASEPASNAGYIAKLNENRLIYDQDKADSIVNFYITLTEDNKSAEQPVTWEELNRITYAKPEGTPKMNVIVQEGDENGPKSGMLGFNALLPNATITLRGKSSLEASQKSYKIELQKSAGYWRDQRTINLVKHSFDFSRIRNKLSFDYFKDISNFTSLRTQFVHLHVRDLSGGPAKTTKFVDYGLYTQIEQPNKSFLRLHGLDPYGQLYKADAFEFFRYPNQLKLATDPTYDKKAFESVLEIKGSNDHSKLLQMLGAVNDMQQDIDKTVDRYFDRDNLFTWMAINLLMDNMDTASQNFLLYSPMNSEKWFLLPWDYDGAWGMYEQNGENSSKRAEWQNGLQNFWGSMLFNRFFKNPKNVEALTAKLDELGKIINAGNSRKMIESYKPIVEPFIRREPDVRYLPGQVSNYNRELERIINLPVVDKQRYLASLQKPMPFFLGDPQKEKPSSHDYLFSWGLSYDLQGDELSYTFELAKDPAFLHPLMVRRDLLSTSLKLTGLTKGQYFWRVRAADEKGNEMSAFDQYTDENRSIYQGVREFYAE